MGLYRDQGVVLRTIKLGEADRIVTLLGQAHGKVRAVAKGVRRSGSRFGARLEPTTHVSYQCYRGRELDVVTQAETIEAHRPLREHYGCLTHAVSMLEAADQVAPEREPDPGRYRMLVGALRELAARPSALVSAAFFWKLLAAEGYGPSLDHCGSCGGEGPFVAFAPDRGALCEACSRGCRRSSAEVLAVIADIVSGRLGRVLAEPPPPEVTAEVEQMAIRSIEFHCERRLRSAALL